MGDASYAQAVELLSVHPKGCIPSGRFVTHRVRQLLYKLCYATWLTLFQNLGNAAKVLLQHLMQGTTVTPENRTAVFVGGAQHISVMRPTLIFRM
jgi:hypothetical protein